MSASSQVASRAKRHDAEPAAAPAPGSAPDSRATDSQAIDSRAIPGADPAADLEASLREQLRREGEAYYGPADPALLDRVAAAWMNDVGNSAHRFDAIEKSLPGARRILDLASGCGTAVYYGLMHGLDVYGIEPERWKHRFNAKKARCKGYPADWAGRFSVGYGEELPYPDDCFDCVSSYQTLEHVQDPIRVVREMIRVTRSGGGVLIQCPDYRTTFEPHYRLPWLPLLPHGIAKLYLRTVGQPTQGLDHIQYVTLGRVKRMLREVAREHPTWTIRVVDCEREEFRQRRAWLAAIPGVYPLVTLLRALRSLFRSRLPVNLAVYLEKADAPALPSLHPR